MNKYKFDCGCEVEIVDNQIKEMDGLPGLHIDYENLRLDCPKVWDFVGEGHTKGIFQLESNLGKAWSRRILPRDVSEMAALISLIRPGILRSIVDGKSMTQHYADRKSGKEEVEAFHEALESILKETYQIMCFQEQILAIAKEIAGFTLKDGEVLRHGIGKKLPEVIASLKNQFIEGCIKVGKVNKEEAEEIFEWIEKSNRYSFNKSITTDALVRIKNGTSKTIDELKIGEYIESPEGYVEVLNKFDHGEQEIYKIELESGKRISCTIQHKFLCEDGVVRPLYQILSQQKRIMCSNTLFNSSKKKSFKKKVMQPEKIISIKKIGKQKTIDIEVDSKSHLFYANGIATSNSHGIGYGLLGVWSGWVKVHFPFHFYTSWLYYAKDKLKPQAEVKQLISDAKNFDISILPPSLIHLREGDFGRFSLHKDKIRFGIKDIKRIGTASSDKLFERVNELEEKTGKSLKQFGWYELLLLLLSKLSLTVVNGIVQVGALDYLDIPRSKMLFEYDIFRKLTSRERNYIIEKCKADGNLLMGLLDLINNFKMGKKRIETLFELAKSLREPPSSLVDSTYKISSWEEDLLGVAVTHCRLDACNPDQLDLINCTCSEFTTSILTNVFIAGEIIEVKEYRTKTGSNMAFLTLEDGSGQLKCIAFSEIWEKNRHKLYPGNTILVCGEASKRDKDTLIIQEAKNI